MLTPGLPSLSASTWFPAASWPTVMAKVGKVTGPPTVRFCTVEVLSFTRSAVMLVGMLMTRLPSVVVVLNRQNSRCDVTVLPLVELKMRRTMSMFADLAPMSGTVIVPVVVTCEANVPSRVMAGGGQSLSLALVQPIGQQPSPLRHTVTGVVVHVAVQVPALFSVSVVQLSPSLQLVGQAPG